VVTVEAPGDAKAVAYAIKQLAKKRTDCNINSTRRRLKLPNRGARAKFKARQATVRLRKRKRGRPDY